MSQKKYSREFKIETVKIVTDKGYTAKEAAKMTGVSYDTLAGWVREYKMHNEVSFPGKGKLHPEDDEMRRLKRKIADLEEENAILKKAAAIFARPQK